jgi:succinate-semialdehyde dehydrogenase/glutarate-semialdehyde dehydrogenase
MHVGGRWVDAESGATFESVSPATGQVLGILPDAGREDARRAVGAASAVSASLAALPMLERARLCHAVADRLDARRDEVAHLLSLEQGKPLAESTSEVAFAADLFRNAAEDVKRLETAIVPSIDPAKRILTLRQPHGAVAVITPWNYPVGIPSQYLSACLAVGNSVVWKPAPTTSLAAVKLLECMLEAGAPDGAVNLVFGGSDVGDEIVSSPGTQAVGFTGSPAVGQAIARSAGAKPVLLELGGNGPTIILDDADIELAVTGTAFGCFSNAGQICQSSERILVHPKVHNDVVEGLIEKARAIRLGHPLESGTTMGPLNNEAVAAKVDEHLSDAVGRGATIVAGGGRVDDFPTRLYYPPNVVDGVPLDSLLATAETFGPVAPVITVPDADAAIAIANDSPYGLCCSVYTGSLSRAFRCAEQLQCGVVNVNESAAYWDGRTPFGGYSGKSSGVGRLGGVAVIATMTQLKSVVLHIGNGGA